MDVLKDAFEAMSQRIRSPIVGSIVLSFLVINWKAVAYLLFADQPLLVRFAFWDGNTEWWTLYLAPIFAGLIAALMLPWITLAGTWIANKPVSSRRILQSKAQHKVQMVEIENKELQEQAKLKLEATRADRLEIQTRNDSVSQENSSADKLEKKNAKINSSIVANTETTPIQAFAVRILSEESIITEDPDDPFSGLSDVSRKRLETFLANNRIATLSAMRSKVEFNQAVVDIQNEGLAKREILRGKALQTPDTHRFLLTAKGYDLLDTIEMLGPDPEA
jgi:hypothetical protein